MNKKLVVGGSDDPFLPHLGASIHQADDVEMAVAFIKSTGLRLLMPDLLQALQRPDDMPHVRIRFITSDYLDVTDAEALRLLALLQEQGAEVKVYEATGSSFHMKAYLFAGARADG